MAAILGAVILIVSLIGISVIVTLIIWLQNEKKGAVELPTVMEAVQSLMGTKIKIGETKSQPVFFTVNETGEVGLMSTIMGVGRISLDITLSSVEQIL